jgi:hypothetical protein
VRSLPSAPTEAAMRRLLQSASSVCALARSSVAIERAAAEGAAWRAKESSPGEPGCPTLGKTQHERLLRTVLLVRRIEVAADQLRIEDDLSSRHKRRWHLLRPRDHDASAAAPGIVNPMAVRGFGVPSHKLKRVATSCNTSRVAERNRPRSSTRGRLRVHTYVRAATRLRDKIPAK